MRKKEVALRASTSSRKRPENSVDRVHGSRACGVSLCRAVARAGPAPEELSELESSETRVCDELFVELESFSKNMSSFWDTDDTRRVSLGTENFHRAFF